MFLWITYDMSFANTEKSRAGSLRFYFLTQNVAHSK